MRDNTELVAFTVRMDPGLHEAVRTFATATESSVNAVINQAAADFMADSGRRKTVEAFFHDAMARFGNLVDKL